MANFAERIKKGSSDSFQSTGQKIMALSEHIRPMLLERLQGYRDSEGKSVHPAQARGMALIMAQSLIKQMEAA